MSHGNESEQDLLIRDEQVRTLRGLAASATERARRWNLIADAIADGLIDARTEDTAEKAPYRIPYSASTGDLTVEQVEGDACYLCGLSFTRTTSFTLGRPVSSGTAANPHLFAHANCAQKEATP